MGIGEIGNVAEDNFPVVAGVAEMQECEGLQRVVSTDSIVEAKHAGSVQNDLQDANAASSRGDKEKLLQRS